MAMDTGSWSTPTGGWEEEEEETIHKVKHLHFTSFLSNGIWLEFNWHEFQMLDLMLNRINGFNSKWIGIEIGTNVTYCRSLRCCRFFLNAFFTRKIKNAARSMDNDGGFFSSPLFSAFSFLSPFSYVFFVVPSFIVWPSRVWRTQAPSEFTFTVTQLIMIIFTWLFFPIFFCSFFLNTCFNNTYQWHNLCCDNE